MAIELITYSGSNVLPEYDASLHDALGGLNGIISGCEVTSVNNGLHIAAGDGILAGRYFKIDEEQIAVTLPASGSVAIALYIHMDLTDADTPIEIIAGPVPAYAYDRTNGIYDLRLATFTAAPGGISSLTDVTPKINPKRIVQRNTAYSAGEVVQCPSVPAGIMLQCTTAGTSAAVEPVGYQTVVSGGTVTDGTAIFTAFRLNKPQQTTIGEIQMGFSAGRTLLTATEAGSYYFSATIYVPYGPGVASAYLRRASDEFYFARQTSVLQSAEYPNYINLSGVIGLAPSDRVVLSLSSPTLSGTCDVTYEIKELV